MTVTVRVRVQRRRFSDVVLVPGNRDAVDAAVAVHARLTLDGLPMPLEHESGEARIRAEVPAVTNRDLGVLGAPRVGLRVNAVDEDAGEEEIGNDRDLAGVVVADGLADSVFGDAEHERVDAERAAVVEAHAGMATPAAFERGGSVVLHVAGAQQPEGGGP